MRKYKKVNGTFYDFRTSDKVVNVLERCRVNGVRITLDYGDVETGESWGEIYDITGTIGRSIGEVKRPILIHNRRSIGGAAISDYCIIGIKESRGGEVLYCNTKKKIRGDEYKLQKQQ